MVFGGSLLPGCMRKFFLIWLIVQSRAPDIVNILLCINCVIWVCDLSRHVIGSGDFCGFSVVFQVYIVRRSQ